MLKTFIRYISVSRSRFSLDLTKKKKNHIPKSDLVEGERGPAYGNEETAYELPSPDLMERLFDGAKFKDIPIMTLKCTRNNTIMSLVKPDCSRILKTRSTGTEGFKNCRKGTTVAAQAVAHRIAGIAKDMEIDQVRFVFRGLGPGRTSAFKVIEESGIKVISLTDRTHADEPWIHRPRRPKSL